VWPKADYPLIEVGVMELNRYPEKFLLRKSSRPAFLPANIRSRIGFSAGQDVQGRLFSYGDTPALPARRFKLQPRSAEMLYIEYLPLARHRVEADDYGCALKALTAPDRIKGSATLRRAASLHSGAAPRSGAEDRFEVPSAPPCPHARRPRSTARPQPSDVWCSTSSGIQVPLMRFPASPDAGLFGGFGLGHGAWSAD